jgi:shikimate kinase
MIYIVIGVSGNNPSVLGVFSNREQAEIFAAEQEADWGVTHIRAARIAETPQHD